MNAQALGLLSSAALLSFLLGRFFLPLAFKWRLVDRPGHRKTHKRAVAYLGGVAVLGGLALSVLAFHASQGLLSLETPGFLPLLACLLPVLAAAGLGLWDDIKELRPRTKLYGQALIALAFAIFAYRLEVLHLPGFAPISLGSTVSVGLTVFFMLAVVNGVNMIDGSDALCLSSSAATLGILAVATLALGQPALSLLSLAGVGACLGFLYWNRPPARMYLGDSGSLGLGFLVAALIVALGKGDPGGFHRMLPNGQPWQSFHYKIALAVFLAGFPALEVTLSVLRRGLQGRALGRGDQGHLHHRMQRLGFSKEGIALTAAVFNLACGGIVLAFLAHEKGLAALLAVGLVVVATSGLQQLGYTRFLQRRYLDERRPHFAIASHFAAMQEAKLSLAQDMEEGLDLVRQTCQELGVRECRISLRSPGEGAWTWIWQHQDQAGAKVGPAERVRVPELGCHSAWTMEIHESEPELDMELKVLMAAFMRKALASLQGFLPRDGQRVAQPFGLEGDERKAMSLRRLKGRL